MEGRGDARGRRSPPPTWRQRGRASPPEEPPSSAQETPRDDMEVEECAPASEEATEEKWGLPVQTGQRGAGCFFSL